MARGSVKWFNPTKGYGFSQPQVRVAEELRSREGVQLLAGTFFSHIGLAITEYAGEKRASFSQPNR
jgi:hypothetical protein